MSHVSDLEKQVEDCALIIGLLIFAAVWLEEKTYERAMDNVKKRRESGDTSCAVRKTFYGWRVVEYAECVDE